MPDVTTARAGHSCRSKLVELDVISPLLQDVDQLVEFVGIFHRQQVVQAHDVVVVQAQVDDFIALDALEGLKSYGYDIPGDIWLAGFDDSTESRRCSPPLTTVHIHTQIMAYEAVRLLRSRIQEPSLDYRRVYTETNLIYRASTPFE